ncbi:MAG: helix-turn-helix domain-containing protein [Betaproteobacteria bacterium]|nr:helix-turn-helix domain-containing protein [Betaproteobacteria bacterium]
MRPTEKPFTLTAQKVSCGRCCLRELCAPIDVTPQQEDLLHALVKQQHLSIRRGDHLYRGGMPFHSLFAIHTGSFKTYMLTDDGRERVEGFYLSGDMLGMDGISGDTYTLSAVALEDTGICVLPFHRLEELTRESPVVQRQFHRMMSREILRDKGIMMMLGQMTAEERLAAFLLNLSQRYEARGFSATELSLRMSRQDIANYLGLKPETVSRLLSRFQDDGIIAISGKNVHIVHIDRLRAVLGFGDGIYFDQLP